MTTANNPVVTDAMIAAGASKVAEMCGHDEEPRGWDKDVARNVYLAMTQASPDEPRNRILEQVRKDREAFARLPKDQQQSALNELKSIGQNPGVTFDPPPDEMVERVKQAMEPIKAEHDLRVCEGTSDGRLLDRLAAAALQSIGPLMREREIADVLRPFAMIADWYDDKEDDTFEIWSDYPHGFAFADKSLAQLKHYRRAAAALKSIGIEDQG